MVDRRKSVRERAQIYSDILIPNNTEISKKVFVMPLQDIPVYDMCLFILQQYKT